MATKHHNFYSDGYKLAALMHFPKDYKEGEVRPAVVVCHGRMAIKEWVPSRWIPFLLDRGFICLSFDYRNLGQSEGTLGKIIPREEVRDVQHAVTFLGAQPEVDKERIGLLGWGLGGGVVAEAAAADHRIRAVACASSVVDGEQYGRDSMLHPDWLKRQREIAEDAVNRVLTGESKFLPRDEFPTVAESAQPQGKRSGYYDSLRSAVGEDAVDNPEKYGIPTTLTYESMQELYTFKPIDSVHKIQAPLMVIHAVNDAWFAYDVVEKFFNKANEPKELLPIHDGDHLDWIDPSHPNQQNYLGHVASWFARHLS